MEKEKRESILKHIHGEVLESFVSALADPKIEPRIMKLASLTRVSLNDLRKSFLAYTLDQGGGKIDNDFYRNKASRLTLYLCNFLEGSFQIERDRLTYSFLEQASPKNLCDVGYGVPAPYHFSYLENNSSVKMSLLDQDPTAEDFARAAIQNEDPKLLSRVDFKTYDMDSGIYPGDADLYIFLDSIEHTKQPAKYLNMMAHKSLPGSNYIFSLPICSLDNFTDFHYAEWLTDNDARKWIENSGLKIVNEGVVCPNPKVDFFAELIEGGFHNYLVLAKKV